MQVRHGGASKSVSPAPTSKTTGGLAGSGLVMRREGRSMIFERAASADGSMRLLAPEAVGSSTYKAAYKNGDAVFLSGNLDDAWTQKEWDRFYGVAKWLVNHDFRVVINPVAMLADVRATVQDDKTKVIIWSSHASDDGVLYDAANKPLPDDILAVLAGKNFKQVIFSACSGKEVTTRYKTAEHVSEIYWEGKTTTDDLFAYLYSDRWNPTQFGENKE